MTAIRIVKIVLPLASGYGFYQVGRAVEGLGDAAKAANDTTSALACHLFAVMALLMALGAFGFALFNAVRWLRGTDGGQRPRSAHARVAAAIAAIDAEPAFDADAVMARYLARRDAAPSVPVPDAKPDPRGFGRKR